jgi:23S rRNA pseudouridine2605 synthase
MRLNRYLARAGVASRRGADEIIAAGRVAVNGAIVKELGTTVDPGSDRVELDGAPVTLPESFTYLIINKPAGYVVTMSDPQGRPTVSDLVPDAPAGVVPVGRLDAATDGLLILTNDGDLAYRVTHPSYEIDKVYRVVARGVLTKESRRILETGLDLEGRLTAPARIEVLTTAHNTTTAEITIHEGRKRQVRRMFEAVGHPVRSLTRIRVGPIVLGDLRPGTWRSLTEDELEALRVFLGLEDG